MNAQKPLISPNPKHRMPLKWVCLLLAASTVMAALGGGVGWWIGTKHAQDAATREREAYMGKYSVGRSLLYGRMTESWTKCLSLLSADVVFLGDSITAGGEWQTYFPFLDTINLGVVGDTTDGLLRRVEQVSWTRSPPKPVRACMCKACCPWWRVRE